MDAQTATAILDRIRVVREKRADPTAQAVLDAAAAATRSEALRDVGHMALLSTGAGLAGGGLAGLVNHFRRQRQRKPRSGPALLPLPYPVEPEEMPLPQLKAADAKWGLPWYGPAMMFTGMGGLGLGWKAADKVLESRRQRERETELDQARHDFHDALMTQYDRPLPATPGAKLAAARPPPAEAGAQLGEVFAKFALLLDRAAAPGRQKAAWTWGDLGGGALGGYGVYAGLSGLLAGSLLYDKTAKRSRRAILEKAIAARQRQRFQRQPTEIYAVPEPVTTLPKPPARGEARLITSPTEPADTAGEA